MNLRACVKDLKFLFQVVVVWPILCNRVMGANVFCTRNTFLLLITLSVCGMFMSNSRQVCSHSITFCYKN